MPLSTTITLPLGSQTMPAGPRNSPGPTPGVPHLRMNLPLPSKTEIVLVHSSDLHVDDELHAAEGRRQRANEKETGTRHGGQSIPNGNRGSIFTMPRSVMDRCAASSACADTRKLSV